MGTQFTKDQLKTETKNNISSEKKDNTEKKEKEYSWKRELAEWIVVIVLAISFAVIINRFFVVNARVPSASMENTVMTGDRLFGNRLAYNHKDPERGDIIIFEYPDDESQLFIKRIIGLPGETVEIKDGKVYINNSEEALNEPYLAQEMIGSYGPYTVPEGAYFVMGDNRNNSLDSRFWINTYVYRDKILGIAWFRYYPFSSFGSIKNSNPQY